MNGIEQQPGEDMGEPTAVVGRGEPAEFVRQVWPAHARQLAPMRTEVRRWLAPLVLPGDAEDDVVLAVNEAASNCVDHAYAAANTDGTIEPTYWTEARCVCIEIVDHGVWRTPADQPTSRGRGIDIMRRLMESVLIHHDRRGTRVFLSYPRSDIRAVRLVTTPTTVSEMSEPSSYRASGRPNRHQTDDPVHRDAAESAVITARRSMAVTSP
jgi:serine/threonine-protein kinase RsbW